jgi:ATP/maltotriose-dependent transcriptional regulator MalT
MKITGTLENLGKRLLAYSEIDTITGCRNWKRGLYSKTGGYGCVRFNGAKLPAHRAAYLVFKGEIPAGLFVRHLCHNRLCIEPKHLEVGTQFDNLQDSVKDKRFQWGENHHNAKLTCEDVQALRHLIAAGLSNVDIAQVFKISHVQVANIRHGKLWQHLKVVGQ